MVARPAIDPWRNRGHCEVSRNLLARNIAANYFGKLWGIASVYAFVPVYIKLLGIESYGVIAFQSVLLSIVWIADAGLTPAFSREAARSEDLKYLRDVLCTLERVYLSICFAVAMVLVLCSGWIANSWLKASAHIAADELQLALALMVVGIAFQLAMSLYVGGLMGRQKQERANALQVAYGIARSAIVILPLLVRPELDTYFAWQAGMGLVFLLVIRRAMWRELSGNERATFSWESLAGVYKFAAGMFMMAIIAALNTQMDKLVASAMFPLPQYAVYSLAALTAQVPTLLTLPVAMAVLPRLTALVEMQQSDALRELYRRSALLIATIASASGALIIAYADALVFLWTRDAFIAAQAQPVVRVLTAGGVCLALQLMPYHLSLANGHNATNIRIGAAFLLITPVLTIWLARRFGLPGAAWPWLLMNAVALVLLGQVLLSRFLPGVLRDWALRDTLLPVAVCAAAALACRMLTDQIASAHAFGTLLAATAVMAGVSVGLLLQRGAWHSALER